MTDGVPKTRTRKHFDKQNSPKRTKYRNGQTPQEFGPYKKQKRISEVQRKQHQKYQRLGQNQNYKQRYYLQSNSQKAKKLIKGVTPKASPFKGTLQFDQISRQQQNQHTSKHSERNSRRKHLKKANKKLEKRDKAKFTPFQGTTHFDQIPKQQKNKHNPKHNEQTFQQRHFKKANKLKKGKNSKDTPFKGTLQLDQTSKKQRKNWNMLNKQQAQEYLQVSSTKSNKKLKKISQGTIFSGTSQFTPPVKQNQIKCGSSNNQKTGKIHKKPNKRRQASSVIEKLIKTLTKSQRRQRGEHGKSTKIKIRLLKQLLKKFENLDAKDDSRLEASRKPEGRNTEKTVAEIQIRQKACKSQNTVLKKGSDLKVLYENNVGEVELFIKKEILSEDENAEVKIKQEKVEQHKVIKKEKASKETSTWLGLVIKKEPISDD